MTETVFKTRALIGDTWCGADDGGLLAVSDPATGETIAQVPLMGAAETRRAIAAAEAALPAWRGLTARARADKLHAWHVLLLDHADDLARLMTL